MFTMSVVAANGNGWAWNGPVCQTCDKPYLGVHSCDPEALVAKADRLMELAAVRFDERLAAGEPVEISTLHLRRCPTRCDADCDADCHELHQVSYKRTHAREDHQ